MSKPNEERDIYYIPPNFLASGRLFGGMIRARNAIEACVLVLMTGIPIIKLPMRKNLLKPFKPDTSAMTV